MQTKHQLPMEIVRYIQDIPIYQSSITNGYFPVLDKPTLAENFPANWMTPALAEALVTGEAEMVLSTGTNHARMQIIRPPLFLLHSYYELWSQHPDIGDSWEKGCQRVSLTTVLATEHVQRINNKKSGVLADRESRRLDARTLYLNKQLEPAKWSRASIIRILDDIKFVQQQHPCGLYHLDCSSYHLVHFLLKLVEFGLEKEFPEPASIIHAYEFTPANVRAFLIDRFNCPVIDLFGSTELGYLFYNDRQGQYYPHTNKMHLELIPLEEGSTIYSLIVSSIRNPWMPLIRYRSGDCVQTTDNTADPNKVRRVCGREKEMLVTNKRLMSQADFDDLIAIFASNIFIYHLHKKNSNTLELSYTTFNAEPVAADNINKLKQAISTTTGMSVSITWCTFMGIGKSGKYAWISQ
ncbi:hypothetical protein RHD99_13955 [Buttiauxella selenatireducens]|uniref:Phenylacetate-CoA ligase n=1 Tax=Buttiauxella selenatireducens TaxID=3073902 RepID=A0ABY9S507_9ENTR|nr:hypothetical protein [Buttiauxella sp. R73]WMY72584.1 hypothetical protein RHD99_13955 [Buttiauxella sp. R73]